MAEEIKDNVPRLNAWLARHGGTYTPPIVHSPMVHSRGPCPYNPQYRWESDDGAVDVGTFDLGRLVDALEALEARGVFEREEVAEVF